MGQLVVKGMVEGEVGGGQFSSNILLCVIIG